MKLKRSMSAVAAAALGVSLCACGTVKSSIFAESASAFAESSTETVISDFSDSESTDYAEMFSMWKEDGAITELIAYVEDVTDENSENYIPVEDRIAVFDLDGTLVGERAPIYFEWMLLAQRVFADDTFEATDEMKSVAEEILTAGESRSIPSDLEAKEYKVYGEAFAGMTMEEYETYVEGFLSQEVDGFDGGLTYGDSYYRPMTQILSFLEANDFLVYIVSGTDRASDRVMARQFTDVANYRVIGTDYYTAVEEHLGEDFMEYQVEAEDELVRTDEGIIKNVKASKVVQMAQEIGQKPVLAFGNSTGDFSMLEYTTSSNPYKSAAFYLLPDDDVREYANMEKAEELTALCEENGWTAISMKEDFLTIYGEGITKNPDDHDFLDSLLEKVACGTETAAESGSETAGTTESGNLISEYMDKGYTWREYSIDNNNQLAAVMGAADDSDFVKITIPITDDEVTAYETIDVFDEQYKEKCEEWLRTAGGAGAGTAESMADQIPSQDELDELIGKTGADLEAMDYSKSGFEMDENDNLYYDYSYYEYDEDDNAQDITVKVWFEGMEGKTSDDISDEMIWSSIVSKVEFKAFGQ